MMPSFQERRVASAVAIDVRRRTRDDPDMNCRRFRASAMRAGRALSDSRPSACE